MKTTKIIIAIALVVAIQGTVSAQWYEGAAKGLVTGGVVNMLTGRNPLNINNYIQHSTPGLTGQFRITSNTGSVTSSLNAASAAGAARVVPTPMSAQEYSVPSFETYNYEPSRICSIPNQPVYDEEILQIIRRGPARVDLIGRGFDARLDLSSSLIHQLQATASAPQPTTGLPGTHTRALGSFSSRMANILNMGLVLPRF